MNGRRRRRRPRRRVGKAGTGFFIVAVAALLAAMSGLIAPSPAIAADAAPTQATVFEHGNDPTKVVTLTFDADFWSPGDVTTVLSVLRANGITAGFGLTGRYAEKYPDQFRQIMAAGHKLLNHTYDHPGNPADPYDPANPSLLAMSQAQRWAEFDRAEAVYNSLGYTSAGWFRTPSRIGYTDPGLNRDLASHGYYIDFDWAYDTTGYQGSSLAVILDRVHRFTAPGAIVLMHLGAGSTDTQYLPQIIAELRAMGYGFTSPYQALTWGAIRARWLSLGAQHSMFGAPVTPEMIATSTGAVVQWYQRGRFYWHGDTGAVFVFGGILDKYISLGTVTSYLGLPVTDELAGANGGAYNDFQYGSIFWSPSIGPHAVIGGIRVKWIELGREGGFLGYPLTDEVAVTGGRASQFEHGNIYWSATTGSHVVYGGILSRYLSIGGSASPLGLPVTDEYAVSGGRRSDFQHGSILWNATTGTTVIYR